MSSKQALGTISRPRVPRNVKFSHQIRKVWGEEAPEWRARVLCEAVYGPNRFNRFVWWTCSYNFPTVERAELAASQVMQAAASLFGGAR